MIYFLVFMLGCLFGLLLTCFVFNSKLPKDIPTIDEIISKLDNK